MNQNSLYQRLGGRDAIQMVVTKMYEKILSDQSLKPFFKDIDLTRLRRSQISFLTYAFDGPHNYTGQGLRNAHQKYVDKGLTDMHFDAVAAHLKNALIECNVNPDLITQVLSIVETTRHDVLCK